MSKFADKLSNLGRTAAPAMGFHREAPEARSASMLVLAEAAGKSEEEIKQFSDAGAAGIILDGTVLTSAALAKYLKQKDGMMIGLSLAGTKASGVKLVTGEVDFMVYGTEMPLSAFEGKDIESTGKVLRVDVNTEGNLLRAAHNLHPAVDAVMIDMRVAGLTVEHLMACRRVFEVTGQPILALVGRSLASAELMALREAGVRALVPGPAVTAKDVQEMADVVSSLPKPEKRKGAGATPFLPRPSAPPAPEAEGEDDGDSGDNDDD